MLSTGFDLLSLQRQRSVLAPKPRVNTASVAKLSPSFAPTPNRSSVGMAVATLGPTVVLVLLFALVILLISVNKFFRSMAVALLQVEPTSVAQWFKSCGFPPPERGRSGLAMGTFFPSG